MSNDSYRHERGSWNDARRSGPPIQRHVFHEPNNDALWRDLNQPLHEPEKDPPHSESCTPANRSEGWYPQDCERCELWAREFARWGRPRG